MHFINAVLATFDPYRGASIRTRSRPVNRRHSRPSNETPDYQAAQRRRRQIARGLLTPSPLDLYHGKPMKDHGRQVRPHRSGGGYRHETWSDL
jgi:hypothetical protein